MKVKKIIEILKKLPPNKELTLAELSTMFTDNSSNSRYQKVLDLIEKTNRCSVYLLTTRLGFTYREAVIMIDTLEKNGVLPLKKIIPPKTATKR